MNDSWTVGSRTATCVGIISPTCIVVQAIAYSMMFSALEGRVIALMR